MVAATLDELAALLDLACPTSYSARADQRADALIRTLLVEIDEYLSAEKTRLVIEAGVSIVCSADAHSAAELKT